MSSATSMYINGDDFVKGLQSGIYKVINAQEKLNSINVFPVADGDTGTNLSLSLHPLLEVTNNTPDKDVGSLLAIIADTLLDHSRGNSGSIMAQFFQGMSDSANNLQKFTPHDFSKSLTLGSEYARDALSKPVDGTIITVIAAFAKSFEDELSKNLKADFSIILAKAINAANEAVKETKNQLDVLRNSNVEDAGAKGFYILTKGLVEYILHGKSEEKPKMKESLNLNSNESINMHADDVEFQYCTECIITGNKVDRRKLRDSLSKHGNSIVIAGSKRKIKVHIHTDFPDTIFSLSKKYGSISSEKADDMKSQQKIVNASSGKFAVITDSAADITDDDIEHLDIHMVPVRLQFGEKGYLDKVSISPDEFYTELATNPIHPTTSQPSIGDFRRQFQYLASHYSDVISINVTGSLSGTLQAAISASKKIKAKGNIHIFNSRNASIGQGQIVVFAAKCAKAGMDINSTLDAIEKIRSNTKSYVIIRNLEYPVRGGRVPTWVKFFADLLNLTPILRTTKDGFLAAKKFLLGKKNILRKASKYIAGQTTNTGKVSLSIAHALSVKEAETLKSYLMQDIPNACECKITELGSGIGVHGGPGAIAIGVQNQPNHNLNEI